MTAICYFHLSNSHSPRMLTSVHWFSGLTASPPTPTPSPPPAPASPSQPAIQPASAKLESHTPPGTGPFFCLGPPLPLPALGLSQDPERRRLGWTRWEKSTRWKATKQSAKVENTSMPAFAELDSCIIKLCLSTKKWVKYSVNVFICESAHWRNELHYCLQGPWVWGQICSSFSV